MVWRFVAVFSRSVMKLCVCVYVQPQNCDDASLKGESIHGPPTIASEQQGLESTHYALYPGALACLANPQEAQRLRDTEIAALLWTTMSVPLATAVMHTVKNIPLVCGALPHMIVKNKPTTIKGMGDAF